MEGSRRGVLRLTETDSGTNAETAITGADTVALISKGGAARAYLAGGRASLPVKGAYAAAVGEKGRLVAAGFSERSAENPEPRARVYERLRMLLAEDEGSGNEREGAEDEPAKERTQSGEEAGQSGDEQTTGAKKAAPANEKKAEDGMTEDARKALAERGFSKPKSPVSENVLQMAMRLFGSLFGGAFVNSSADAARKDMPLNDTSPAGAAEGLPVQREAESPGPKKQPAERVRNPFPKHFPRSEWHREGSALVGGFVKNGSRFEVRAVPAAQNRENTLIWANRIRSADGIPYFVEVREEKRKKNE